MSVMYIAGSLIPISIQALVMVVDEFYFHRRRGLPRWERIGHPLDTLTVLLPLLVACFFPLSWQSAAVFAAGALFSCLFVTKDEFIHARNCTANEQWLHSLLFVFHPLVFLSYAVFWCLRDRPDMLAADATLIPLIFWILPVQALLLVCFAVYQLIYWNILRQQASGSDERLMTRERKSESADLQSCASEIG